MVILQVLQNQDTGFVKQLDLVFFAMEYGDIQTRKKHLQKQGRCFICLKGGHISKE